jgi:hypothetical protein
VHLTYDSGADRHYVSKDNRKEACMPILRSSSKKVEVANGGKCKAKNVTRLPFPQLSELATTADTFNNFPTSLMSVGKTFQRRHHLNIHKNRSDSTQRNRCTHQMQRSTTTHRSTGQTWTTSHSTNSKERTMATKNPIQKSSTRARKSKQCVRSTIHRTRN